MIDKKMRVVWKAGLAVFALLTLFFVVVLSMKSAQVQASNSIVINEIMYNPASDNQLEEYLEIYNASNDTVDISGWCFTSGISLCFSDGTEIQPGEYVVISPDQAQTQSTYGVATIATYTGALSNGGEQITLTDDSSTIVDTLTYDDADPWPTSPDGGGPSLELIDYLADNQLAQNWRASLAASGTPAEVNSNYNVVLPELSNVSQPQNVTAATAPVITANISGATTVDLVYKVMFGGDVRIEMFDDGQHGDGASGDGVFGAIIPTQSAGELVRYRVEAQNNDGTALMPSVNDSINYYGYVVQNPAANNSTPQLQLFMPDEDFTAMVENPLQDDTYYAAVIAYGNQVFDNSEIRLKGEYSRTFPKKPFKVKLPSGYKLAMEGVLQYPLNEFHLNSDFAVNNYVYSLAAWRAFEHAGFEIPQIKKIQLQRNGQFEGAYTLAEKYDKEWYERNPDRQDDEVYEDWSEKVQPEDSDTTNRDEWKSNTLNLTGEARRKYILDNYDIPNIINYMAVQSVIRGHDWSSESNTFSYLDTEGNGRWGVYPWDLDITFNTLGMPDYLIENIPGYGRMVDPYDRETYITEDSRFFVNAIWDDPIWRDMYKRRIRTLVDEIYVQGRIFDWVDEEYAIARDAAYLDYQKWYNTEDERLDTTIRMFMTMGGLDPNNPADVETYFKTTLPDIDISQAPDPISTVIPWSPDNRMFLFKVGLEHQRDKFLQEYVLDGSIPESQPNSRVTITEVMYNPNGSQEREYIELYNPNSYAVDVSGWTISGSVSMTLPGGGVLPPNGYAVVVANDKEFRSEYGGGVLVLSEYESFLPNNGGQLVLKQGDKTIVKAVYGSSGLWPSLANGQGKSLGLVRINASTVTPQCWAPSSNNGGTPGLENVLDATWVAKNKANCNDYNAKTNNDNKGSKKDIFRADDGQDFIGLLVGGTLQANSDVSDTGNNENCGVQCDSDYQGDLLPQLNQQNIPKTGDSDNVLVIVSVVAGGVAGTLILIRVILVKI
jgi:hypothetical protein